MLVFYPKYYQIFLVKTLCTQIYILLYNTRKVYFVEVGNMNVNSDANIPSYSTEISNNLQNPDEIKELDKLINSTVDKTFDQINSNYINKLYIALNSKNINKNKRSSSP